MRQVKFIIFLGLTFLIIPVVFSSETGKQNNQLRFALGETYYLKCGLDKLSPAEETELINLIVSGPSHSYTTVSADRYMEREGWRKVSVVGAVPTADHFDDHWLLIRDRYNYYILDPFSSPDLPEPGLYWARNSLSSLKILYPDGQEVSFTAKDIN